MMMQDVRQDFPFLKRTVNGKPIIYFDNAATTQKPQQVIDCLLHRYISGIANVHRSVNFLADEVTEDFEQARETMARLIGAHAHEVIFVLNATQAINIIGHGLSRKQGRPLHVVTTTLEHHSNLLPWVDQGRVEFVPWNEKGEIHWDTFVQYLAGKPDLVTVASASNFLGSIHPIKSIVAACRKAKIPVLIDASQSIAHEAYDVRELDCDYFVFSGHKMYGPSGTGVLYVRQDAMEQLPPLFLGGSMIKEVHADGYVLNDLPYRFEAGTPNIEGVVALAAAARYISRIGYDRICEHESDLVQYAKAGLRSVPDLKIYGPASGQRCAPLVTFTMKRLAPTAVVKILGERANVIIRSGFHCAQPAHDQLGIGPTIRASFGIYNTKDEIDCMVDILNAVAGFI